MPTLTELAQKNASADDIETHLSELPSQQRVAECASFPGRLMPQLFKKIRQRGELNIQQFVGDTKQTAIYELKNSLPVFNLSQKRFYRPATGEVVGYNHTGTLSRLTGPGYFFALNGDDGELVFDYTRLPSYRPPGWPSILPNTGLVAGPTYGGMLDYVRYLGPHTVLGAAFRDGKPRHAYFLLTRSAAQS